MNEKWIMCERCKRAAKLNVMMPRCTECHWEPFRGYEPPAAQAENRTSACKHHCGLVDGHCSDCGKTMSACEPK
jgi:hypothetical protein